MQIESNKTTNTKARKMSKFVFSARALLEEEVLNEEVWKQQLLRSN